MDLIEIIPAIIAKDFDELEKKIKLVEPYVDWVQLDVMDGKFAPEKSWPYTDSSFDCHPEFNSGSNIKGFQEMLKQVSRERDASKQHDSRVNLEAHLMIEEPEKEIDRWIESGVKRILIHIESTNEIESLIKKIKDSGLEAGVVLNLETPIEVLDRICHCESASRRAKQSRDDTTGSPRSSRNTELALDDDYVVDVIQLMAIAKIGYHGHAFDEKVIHKIKGLKEGSPNVKISVDGGINLKTAPIAAAAGADILAAGSAIFNSNKIGETINQLKDIQDN